MRNPNPGHSPDSKARSPRNIEQLDYGRLASELLRAVRNRRSQADLSRRLGFAANAVQRWESGRCWPTASVFLRACESQRIPVARCYETFFRRAPDWLVEIDGCEPAAIAAFLRQLQGKTPIAFLARASGFNRFTVSRWLSGAAEPRLPEFLAIVQAASRRLLDFVATLVDPNGLPSVRGVWRRLEQSRKLAYEHPWSHAVLRAVESVGTEPDGGWTPEALGELLGIDGRTAEDALQQLKSSGQLRRIRGKLKAQPGRVVDTSPDLVRSTAVKVFWADVALQRLRAGHPGSYGYSLFAVSRADLRQLRQLHLEYLRAMQTLIARSSPSECVGLYCAQLLDLDVSTRNALTVALAK